MKGLPMRVACLSLACLVVLLPCGCQRAVDRLTEAAIQRATVGAGGDAGGADARGRGPATSADAAESLPLPDGFPRDVYLPRGYAVNSVVDLQDVSVLSLSAPGEVSSLFGSARAAMRAQGWRQTLAAQHSVDAAMLAFEKDADGQLRRTTLSFNRSHGEDRVIVGVQLRRDLQ